ncbi:histone RNA hairpin-binding protein, putative [Plasmodium chabaudi chabaudi]|uniref:Histone RNA hairpin-binding protein, putative n=1 Tax=Plasmodium chabaudi chabaudi TaxID=31271 RepID=A0A4V6M9K7_PLACU|nr:histone RNA hairpin-binding protein, putative [Plasmodium chabaudi chabaudi]VTZ69815.1 histone RNA hairpin-binding protein, putative [Plasmodium chabaudi chabaudi]|eukprot:XP_739709.2 conserved Plasmodium protein, unknown function [Plasmodium chabaudi chabaudi]
MNDASSFQRFHNKFSNNELKQSQINQRLKNINLTKRLISYERYIKAIPKNKRNPNLKNDWHPETPRINKQLSVSQWNKEMKKWRKQIHAWGNMPEYVYKHICNLSFADRNKYLSELKLLELSQVEINNLKKKNEQCSEIIVNNILLIPEQNNNTNICANSGIIEKPFFFLPQNFSGTILNDQLIIIKQNYLEKCLYSLQQKYTPKYAHLFDAYNSFYIMARDPNLNCKKEKKEQKTITVKLNKKFNSCYENGNNKNGEIRTSQDILKEYMNKQEIQASKYLHSTNTKKNSNYRKGKRHF